MVRIGDCVDVYLFLQFSWAAISSIEDTGIYFQLARELLLM